MPSILEFWPSRTPWETLLFCDIQFMYCINNNTAHMHTQGIVIRCGTQIRKIVYIWSLSLWCQPVLSLWYTDQNHNNTSFPPPPLLGFKMKCQNPEAEGDHNTLIINRKCLHYELKDRKECSLVTALTQIHTFLRGLGRAGSPLLPSHCLSPGHSSGYSWDVEGFGGLQGGAGRLWMPRVAWQSRDNQQPLPCDFAHLYWVVLLWGMRWVPWDVRIDLP